MKKKGFTLVELLAVIVILAIILIIAVPQIMDTIEKSRKASFESTAKLVADAAEKQYTTEQTLGKNVTGWETGIDCKNASWSGINNTNDYNTCTVKIVNGTAYVTITGNGKFDKYLAKDATKTDAETIKGIAGQIVAKNTSNNTEGLALTSDGNIRYVGNNTEVKNYVWFNCDEGYTSGSDHCELWRIIGVFDNGVKIIRNASIGSFSWDSSNSTINEGSGVNEWSQADLMTELNTYYLNRTSGTCFNGINATKTTNCNTENTGLKPSAQNMITPTTWYTGASNKSGSDFSTIKALDAYNNERNSTNNGKICPQETLYCTDTVSRTTTWTGFVGLMSLSDYGYASNICAGVKNLKGYADSICTSSNWLYNEAYQWTISPCALSSYAHFMWFVYFSGAADNNGACNARQVRPVVFLKDSVQITGNDGSSSTPYTLG